LLQQPLIKSLLIYISYMFDDQNDSKGSPPSNLPFQPEDMLAGVETDGQNSSVASQPDALSAGLLKPKTSSSIPPSSPAPSAASPVMVSYDAKSPILGKVLGAVIGVVVLSAIGFGGWSLYSKVIKKAPEPSMPIILNQSSQSITPTPLNVDTSTSPATANPIASTTPTLTGDTTDTDRDGLTDEEERLYGTAVNNPDTDADGSSDFEELKIWGTDPNNPDTDAYSYKDGEEVKNGYNPRGSGKLPNLPTTSTVKTGNPTPSSSGSTSAASTSVKNAPTSTAPTSAPRL
jgi:cell division septation protein DedD